MPEPMDFGPIEKAYKLEQKQRRMEREIRKWKRLAEGSQDPMNAVMYRKQMREAQKNLREFISQTNEAEGKEVLRRSPWREKTFGVPELNENKLTDTQPDGILNTKAETNREVSELAFIGRIDVEKYRCVTEDIVTDEVIITTERIQHIKDRHPDDYEKFAKYMEEIVQNPDYILEANKPNTAFILKKVEEAGEHFELILRLKISSDPVEYKNSVMTFLKIAEKKWDKYLRNKRILYKNE